jgi:ADP-ribose pyrophosphatase
MQKPSLVSRSSHFRGRVVDAGVERVRFADGREDDLDLIRHPGAAAMVAIDASERVCLVKQYRHGYGDFMWEIPAGKLDGGEAPEICAVRELAEEAGTQARYWASLGAYWPAAGILTEVVHLFLATELTLGAVSPDADEELEILWLPLNIAIERVLDGTYSDGKTALGLFRARHALRR